MHSIIKDNQVTTNEWITLDEDHQGSLPEGNLLLPLKDWLDKDFREQCDNGTRVVGVWLNSDDQVEQLADAVHSLPIIAVNFPVFADGRGFSLARQLRENLNYDAELRAIGSAIRDQLFYLKRCGFNAFDLGSEVSLDDALVSMNDFSVTYQASVEQPEPLYRRHQL